MKRLPLSIFLLVALIAISQLAHGHIGTSVECVNSECLAQASSSPLSVLLGVLLFFAIARIPRHAFSCTPNTAGLLRKVGAFIFDIILTLVSFGALLALPSLITESFYSGIYQWEFSRHFVRVTDWLFGAGGVGLIFAIVFYMRHRAKKLKKPSFGQYVMGYVVQDGKALRFEYS